MKNDSLVGSDDKLGGFFDELPDLDSSGTFDVNYSRGMEELGQHSGRVFESFEWGSLPEDTTWEEFFRLSSPSLFSRQPPATSAPEESKGMETTWPGEIVPYVPNQPEDEGTKKQTDGVRLDPSQHPENQLLPSLCRQIREKLKEASKVLKGHQEDSKGDLKEQDAGQSNSKPEDAVPQAQPKNGDGVRPACKIVGEVQCNSKPDDGAQPHPNIQHEEAQFEFKIGDWALTPIPYSFCALTATANQPPAGINDESMGFPKKKPRTKTVNAGELPLRFKLLPGFGYMAQKVDEKVALQVVVPSEKTSILPRLPFAQRLEDWAIKRRQRADRRYDLYYYHKESNVTFRSTNEVADFIVYNFYPSTANVIRKRKAREETEEREIGTDGQTSSNEKRGSPIRVEDDAESGFWKTPDNKLEWDGQSTIIECQISPTFGGNIRLGPPNENKRRKTQKGERQKNNDRAPSTSACSGPSMNPGNGESGALTEFMDADLIDLPDPSTFHTYGNNDVLRCCNHIFSDFNDCTDANNVQVAVHVLSNHFSANAENRKMFFG